MGDFDNSPPHHKLARLQIAEWSPGCEGVRDAAIEAIGDTDPITDLISFDEKPLLVQEQNGCFVQAWVWVANVYIEEPA